MVLPAAEDTNSTMGDLFVLRALEATPGADLDLCNLFGGLLGVSNMLVRRAQPSLALESGWSFVLGRLSAPKSV